MARFCGRVLVTLWLLAHLVTVARGVQRAGVFRAEVDAARGRTGR